jgi:sigma-E factor negative regulatory protein RseC
MDTKNQIEHDGFIKQIENDKIIVEIASASACVSCQIKGFCAVSEVEMKDIEVYASNTQDYKVGQKVTVVLAENLGIKAVFLGYFLPFIFLVVTLFVLFNITKNELWSGLGAVGILIPYYLILSLFKKKISKEFTFKIK